MPTFHGIIKVVNFIITIISLIINSILTMEKRSLVAVVPSRLLLAMSGLASTLWSKCNIVTINMNIIMDMIIMIIEPGDSETKVSSKDVNKDGVSSIDGPDVISTNHFVDHKNGDLQHLSSVNITMIVMIVMIIMIIMIIKIIIVIKMSDRHDKKLQWSGHTKNHPKAENQKR